MYENATLYGHLILYFLPFHNPAFLLAAYSTYYTLTCKNVLQISMSLICCVCWVFCCNTSFVYFSFSLIITDASYRWTSIHNCTAARMQSQTFSKQRNIYFGFDLLLNHGQKILSNIFRKSIKSLCIYLLHSSVLETMCECPLTTAELQLNHSSLLFTSWIFCNIQYCFLVLTICLSEKPNEWQIILAKWAQKIYCVS